MASAKIKAKRLCDPLGRADALNKLEWYQTVVPCYTG